MQVDNNAVQFEVSGKDGQDLRVQAVHGSFMLSHKGHTMKIGQKKKMKVKMRKSLSKSQRRISYSASECSDFGQRFPIDSIVVVNPENGEEQTTRISDLTVKTFLRDAVELLPQCAPLGLQFGDFRSAVSQSYDSNDEDKESCFRGDVCYRFLKTKRNEEKENETQTLSEVEEKAKELQGKSEELKTAMDKFASTIEPNNEKIEGITPTVRQRQNLGDRKTSSNTIVYIVDAPANVGSDGAVGSIGPTGGGPTPSLKNMNQDQTRDIMRKIQKVMLQS